MADETDVLFKEIDDDLRQDQASKLWATYGKYIIGAAVAIIVGTAALQGWKSYDLKQRQAAGETFAAAQQLADEKKLEEALKAFTSIAENGSGYAVLASFRSAALMKEAGDLSGAVGVYQKLADDGDLSTYYRDMAIILGAMLELDIDANALIGRVASVDTPDNTWRHGAREVLGLSALKSGDNSKAKEIFKALADDATAPASLKSRASEMVSILGD